MNFEQFLDSKLEHFAAHMARRLLLLDSWGSPLQEIDLSFGRLADEFIEAAEAHSHQPQDSVSLALAGLNDTIKLNDKHLERLLEHCHECYALGLNLEGQNISDKTLLRLAALYTEGRCAFTRLKVAGNTLLTSTGAAQLGRSLLLSPKIRALNFHGLDIGGPGVKYPLPHAAASLNSSPSPPSSSSISDSSPTPACSMSRRSSKSPINSRASLSLNVSICLCSCFRSVDSLF